MNASRFYDYRFSLVRRPKLDKHGRTALLVVDMQYHDTSPDYGWGLALERINPGSLIYYHERVQHVVIPTIQKLLAYFRAHGLPVIFVTVGAARNRPEGFWWQVR